MNIFVQDYRVIIWKQWKVPSKRQWGLQNLGLEKIEQDRHRIWETIING
ncbi:MAG: hypothetical protein ACLTAQ_07220 [Longicatena caecimuris]